MKLLKLSKYTYANLQDNDDLISEQILDRITKKRNIDIEWVKFKC